MVSPAPNFEYTPDPPKRAWWRWSLGLTALLLIYLMWQCGSALRQGRALAEPAVQAFHTKLNAANYEEIYQEAGEAFQGTGQHDELVQFLTTVHTKLGDAHVTNQVNMFVNAQRPGRSSWLDMIRHSLEVRRLRRSHGLRKAAI